MEPQISQPRRKKGEEGRRMPTGEKKSNNQASFRSLLLNLSCKNTGDRLGQDRVVTQMGVKQWVMYNGAFSVRMVKQTGNRERWSMVVKW